MQPNSALYDTGQGHAAATPLQNLVMQNPSNYTYTPDNTGGLNYFLNGTPISNAQYGAGTGADTTALEKQAAQSWATNQVNGANKTPGATGTGIGTSGGYQPPDYTALANAYNGQFDNSIGNLNHQQQLAQQIGQSGQNQVNQSYGIQEGGLEQQLAQGNSGLDLAQQKLDTYKSNGLRDLGSEMRQSVQSYGNQLGVNGAGDSSAVGLANFGLSQQANRAANDINTSAGQQQTGLNQQRSNIQTGFDQNKKMLDDWKSQQIQNITNNYATQLQQIQSQIGSGQSQRAVDLAYIGKGQAANQALSQLQSLEQQYGNYNNQLQQTYGDIKAPTAQIQGYDQQFQVNPLSTQQLSASNLSNTQTMTDPSSYTPIKLKSSTATA